MAALTHLIKRDETTRSTTSTTLVELTDYTITWEDLDAAGFQPGDDVVIIVCAKPTGSANSSISFAASPGCATTSPTSAAIRTM